MFSLFKKDSIVVRMFNVYKEILLTIMQVLLLVLLIIITNSTFYAVVLTPYVILLATILAYFKIYETLYLLIYRIKMPPCKTDDSAKQHKDGENSNKVITGENFTKP